MLPPPHEMSCLSMNAAKSCMKKIHVTHPAVISSVTIADVYCRFIRSKVEKYTSFGLVGPRVESAAASPATIDSSRPSSADAAEASSAATASPLLPPSSLRFPLLLPSFEPPLLLPKPRFLRSSSETHKPASV